MVVALTNGDITQRDAVQWGYTIEECGPYIKHMSRKILFREAVIAALTGETAEAKQKRAEKEYCSACRTLKPESDCVRCEKKIEVKDA